MGERPKRIPPAAWMHGVLLAVAPIPRTWRYRLRRRSPLAARASDALADRALTLMLLLIALCAGFGVRPNLSPNLRISWLGSAFGLLTGLAYVHERRQLRRRLRELPPAGDPLAEVATVLPDVPAACDLAAGRASAALAAASAMDRDSPVGLRIGALAAAALDDQRSARARALRAVQVDASQWDVASGVGLVLCDRGRFGEGIRLLERGADASDGAWRAELMLAQGLAMAGRLRDAVEAFDRSQGRPLRR